MKILEAIHARGTHIIVAIVTKFFHRIRYTERYSLFIKKIEVELSNVLKTDQS